MQTWKSGDMSQIGNAHKGSIPGLGMIATSEKHLRQNAVEDSWLLGYFQRPERAGYFSTGQRPVTACTVFFRGNNNQLLKNISPACHGISINSSENTSRIGYAHQGKYSGVRDDRHKWKTLAAGCRFEESHREILSKMNQIP